MCGRLTAEFNVLGGQAGAQAWSCFSRALVLLATGDVAGAAALMEQQDQVAKHPTVAKGGRAMHAAQRVMFAIRQGDLAAAVKWGGCLAEYDELNDIMDIRFHCVPSRLLIAQGEKAAAMKQLQEFYQKANQAGAQGVMIKIRVYQTLAAATPEEALDFLSEALKMGAPEGFIRTFVDEGGLLAPLLRKALSQGITPEYTNKLLNIIENEDRQRKALNQSAPCLPPSALLSERELEILRLVAAGQSNREIAAKLVIAIGTAKTHVHRIFEKLNAKDRLQAVTRAREMRLVQ